MKLVTRVEETLANRERAVKCGRSPPHLRRAAQFLNHFHMHYLLLTVQSGQQTPGGLPIRRALVIPR